MEDIQTFINLGVALNEQSEVLIVKRKKEEDAIDGKRLTWAFPGGKMKAGQSREDSAAGEVLAETGYRVKPVRLLSMRTYAMPTVILAYHLCELESSAPVQDPSEPDEIAEIKWVKPSELKDYFTTDIDPKVAKFLGINADAR